MEEGLSSINLHQSSLGVIEISVHLKFADCMLVGIIYIIYILFYEEYGLSFVNLIKKMHT